jgi:hypothetical protein
MGGSGMGSAPSVTEEPVEEATIPLRRPSRPDPAAQAAPEKPAPPPPAPPRPSVPLAAWMPSDDDILPHTQHKRRGRRGR